MGRHKILEFFLSQMTAGIENPKILDVGCRTGANLELLNKFGQAQGIDVAEEAIKFCSEKVLKAQIGLVEELPLGVSLVAVASKSKA